MPAPNRIIFVRQSYNPHGGGELILSLIMAALRGRGLNVAMLTREWSELPAGVGLIHCDPVRRGRALREVEFAEAACRLLASQENAIVQAHEKIACTDIYRAGDGTHAAFLVQMKRARGFLGGLALDLSAFHRNRLRLERALFASPRLRAVIVNSPMVGDDIADRYGFPADRIHLVPNGIDLDRYHPRKREEFRVPVRAELGVTGDRQVLLLAGSGYERKGLAAALEVLPHLPPNVELWVAGRDRKPRRFQRLAERAGVAARVRFLGPQDGLLPLYAAADALILPALYDPFPSTVIEAMATGLPVVTSLSCGAREAAGALDPRLVVDALDLTAMTDAARLALALANDPDTASRARKIAEAYGIDAMIDRLLAVYESVFNEPGRA